MTAKKEYVYKDGKLETEESFRQLEKFMRDEIRRVESNPDAAREYLYRTGMYDKHGKLKPEFA